MTRNRMPLPAPPTALLRLYALAMWSHPRRRRRRFAAEMQLMLEESWCARRLGGDYSPLLFWINAFRDVIANGLLLRFGSGEIREARPPASRSDRSNPPARSPATRIEVTVSSFVQDVKYALRMIYSAPAFAAAVVVTLMLGIGANVAIFSVLNGVVLQPLPYPAADRLVHVWTQFPEQGLDRFDVSEAEFTDYRAASELFEEMFAYQVRNATLTGVSTPSRVRVAQSSAGMWDVLGGGVAHGRLFGADEDMPGNDDVVVLDHAFWQQTFGADPEVIGDTLVLDGFSFEIIGVAAAGLDLPELDAHIYTPLAIDTGDLSERSGHGLRVIGRVVPGAGLDAVLAEMSVVSDRWAEQYTHVHPFTANRLADQVVGDARRPLFLLGGAVAFVLLIACANVAGLLMARTTGRRREIAVRAALGAPRGRLIRQMLTEGVVLAGAGGILGFALAAWGTAALLRLEPGNLPRIAHISMDATVVAFVAGVTLLTGLIFASVPAWRATSDIATVAGTAGVRSTAGTAQRGFQRLMVAVEVAVAIVLVIGSALLVRSFAEIIRIDPGLAPENLVATRVALPPGSYESVDDAAAFWPRLRAELDATSGLDSAAFVRSLPIRDEAYMERFLRAGETEESVRAAGHVPSFDWQTTTPGYFRTLGIPIVAGRDFNDFDRAGSPRVAIISESVAERYFAGIDPVGERIRITASTPDDIPFEIVGIAGDVRHNGLDGDIPLQIFTPYAQIADYRAGLLWSSAVVVRTGLPTAAAAQAMREAVWSIDAELPLAGVSTMEELLADSVARPRFIAVLLSLLSGLALVLASVGVYGVVTYGVAERTREIGIRMALGARKREVVGLVMRDGVAPAAAGVGIGIVGALLLTRLAESQLFGVTATDPATFVAVAGILTVVALLAAWLPARRAARIDALVCLNAK